MFQHRVINVIFLRRIVTEPRHIFATIKNKAWAVADPEWVQVVRSNPITAPVFKHPMKKK